MKKNLQYYNFASIFLGLLLGYLGVSELMPVAKVVSSVFVRIMQCLAVPIIFFSLLSTMLDSQAQGSMKRIWKLTLLYTFVTTLVAATLAVCIYKMWNPASNVIPMSGKDMALPTTYGAALLALVPANILDIFISGNVIGAVVLALGFGAIGGTLSTDLHEVMSKGVRLMSALFLKCTQSVVCGLPLVLWSFTLIFMQDMTKGFGLGNILTFVFAVLSAYTIHAFITLPLLLKWKGFKCWETLYKSMPAWSVAALSKSSAVAIPSTLQVCTDSFGVRPSTARFTVPVCATINMNGCSSLIIVTTAFMLEVYTGPLPIWAFGVGIFAATFLAIGNAGVPMGCFFITLSFVNALGVPTHMMGVLLPVFALLDMYETGVNVWSDVVVTRCINKDLQKRES